MRLDINLASRPYEDAQQFWMRWGTAVGVMALLTLILVTLTITGRLNARRDHAIIAETRAQIADRDAIRASAEEFLNRPENRNTRDTSQLLNEMIERKAFSWTRVLENLEKVMPPRVHVVSISPGLDEDNQLALKMTAAGDSRERALELPRRMEDSGRFAQVSVVSEHFLTQTQNGDTIQLELAAIYVPEAASTTEPDTEPKGAESKGTAKPPKSPQTRPKNPAHPGTPPKISAQPGQPRLARLQGVTP